MKLNLGSGQRPFDSTCKYCKQPQHQVAPEFVYDHAFERNWVNVDCQARWKPDVVCDISSLPQNWTGRADVVVLHQVLEHFDCTGGPALLKECWRVLAPGGRLLVFVPDQVALARRWLEGGIDDYLYNVNTYGAYMGDEADRHKWGWCYRSLHMVLSEGSCGRWETIRPFRWETAPEGADLAKDWWVLAVEAVK